MDATYCLMRPSACLILFLKEKSEGTWFYFRMFMFLLLYFAIRTLCQEKTSSWRNPNDSARTRQKFS